MNQLLTLLSNQWSRLATWTVVAVMVAVAYAVPAILDVIGVRWFGQANGWLPYLLKPVDNQQVFLQLMLLPAAVVLLALMPAESFRRGRWGVLSVLVLAWFASTILSAVASPQPLYSLKRVCEIAPFAAAFVLLCQSQSGILQIRQFMGFIVLSTLPAALYALIQNAGYEFLPYSTTIAGTDDELSGKQLISSVFGHPNYMGSYFAPLILWGFGLILTSVGRSRKIFWSVPVLLMLASLVVGGTRGPLLAVMLSGILYYILLAFAPAYRRLLIFSAVVMLLTAFALFIIPNPIFRVQFDITQRLVGSREIAARFYYWLMAIEMTLDHPVLGIGYGNFDLHFWDYVAAYQAQPDSIYYQFTLEHLLRGVRPGFVHNDILQRLAEGGLLGCGLWLAIWARFFAEGFTQLRKQRALSTYPLTCCFVTSLAAIFIDSLVNFPTHLPVSGFLCFILLGWWVSVSRTTRGT